jgi:hypothetical protein
VYVEIIDCHLYSPNLSSERFDILPQWAATFQRPWERRSTTRTRKSASIG